MVAAGVPVICEIEPATRPELMHVRHQIGVLSTIASAFLIPDNHIGRATVSSIAVAHEVAQMGGRSIACLNARDRNLLGFRRDVQDIYAAADVVVNSSTDSEGLTGVLREALAMERPVVATAVDGNTDLISAQ